MNPSEGRFTTPNKNWPVSPEIVSKAYKKDRKRSPGSEMTQERDNEILARKRIWGASSQIRRRCVFELMRIHREQAP